MTIEIETVRFCNCVIKCAIIYLIFKLELLNNNSIKTRNYFSSTTTSTSSGITKTSYQVKSSVSTGNHVDGLSYNRSKSSPVFSESSYISPSIKVNFLHEKLKLAYSISLNNIAEIKQTTRETSNCL